MEALKVSESLDRRNFNEPSPPVEQLQDLASKKKAEYVAIKVPINNPGICNHSVAVLWLPFESLSNSSARTLHLQRMQFESKKKQKKKKNNDLRLSLGSLLHLHLDRVRFTNPRLFPSLMASSPLLEPLEITGDAKTMSNLNVPNLKTLKLVNINDAFRLFKKEFIAPQSDTLEIDGGCFLTLKDVYRLVSKLENLKYLTVTGFIQREKTMKLGVANLDVHYTLLHLLLLKV